MEKGRSEMIFQRGATFDLALLSGLDGFVGYSLDGFVGSIALLGCELAEKTTR